MDDGGSIFGEEKVKREWSGLSAVLVFCDPPVQYCRSLKLLKMRTCYTAHPCYVKLGLKLIFILSIRAYS